MVLSGVMQAGLCQGGLSCKEGKDDMGGYGEERVNRAGKEADARANAPGMGLFFRQV